MKVSALVVAGLLLFPFSNVSAQEVNDAQIASIVVTANQVDIDAGKLAKSRSTNDEVKAFAELMITDHTSVNKSASDLVAKLKVSPQNNPTSQSLKAGGEKNLAHLKTLKGAAFDKAYVDHEVAYHQQVIDALDKILIPGATNSELKALLIKVRPAFVAHLEHAKRLQLSVGKEADRAIRTLVAVLSVVLGTIGAVTGDQPKSKTHTVTIEGMRFQPEVLTVSPGDTVVWVNKDLVPHTATSKEGGFDSKDIQADKSWRYTIQTTGEFAYICTFHPTMKAMLRVKQ